MKNDIIGIRSLAELAAEEANRSDLFLSVFLAAIVGSYDWDKTPREIVDRAFDVASVAVQRLQSDEGIEGAKRR